MQLVNITDYDMSNETIKEKFIKSMCNGIAQHISHENDKMTTNKWPQFMLGDVET